MTLYLAERVQQQSFHNDNGLERVSSCRLEYFENQRQQAITCLQEKARLKESFRGIHEPDYKLEPPSKRLQNLKQTKNQLKRFEEVSGLINAYSRRERTVKNGWRNGITGVEVPGERKGGFYEEREGLESERAQQKQMINARRVQNLHKELVTVNVTKRDQEDPLKQYQALDKETRKLHQHWNVKRRVNQEPMKLETTFNNLFNLQEKNRSMAREEKLREVDTRGKLYNLITGELNQVKNSKVALKRDLK